MFGWLSGQKRLSQKWPHTRLGLVTLSYLFVFLGKIQSCIIKLVLIKKNINQLFNCLNEVLHNKPYKIPCYAECFCFELGQRYLYYYNIFAFTIHKITVIGTDKNTQKQLKNLAAKNNSEPVKNTGTKVHYEFSNFFRHPNETAPLSLTSAHI